MTTKTLDLSANNGVFYVSFDVKGWSSVEGDIKISLDGTQTKIVEYTAKMTDVL